MRSVTYYVPPLRKKKKIPSIFKGGVEYRCVYRIRIAFVCAGCCCGGGFLVTALSF